MYYEEKLINGVLYCKSTPCGSWRQVSIESMSEQIIELKKEVCRLEDELYNMTAEQLHD